MIKRLRIKFVCITMVLLTAMLLVIFGLVCHFTASGLKNEAVAALKAAADTPLRPGRPGNPGKEHQRPCFSLERTPYGELVAQGGEFYDLTDAALMEALYQAALAEKKHAGTLEEWDLRYYRAETPVGIRVAFTALSGDRHTMQSLVGSCVVIGVIAVLAFLGITTALAFWWVRPVEKAWQQQRQFVADASHELKTPLTVILTNAELLRSREYEEAEQAKFADSILTMSHQMRNLVASLLDMARADRLEEKRECETLDLSELVEDAVLPFEPVYFENGRVLDSAIAPEITVKGDGRHLHQVVEILLDNGVKYSAPGSTTMLTLTKQSRGKALLTVKTPGTPLTRQQCEDVFKRFYRTDAARSRDGSYGLGLSIAQRIVTSHGGRIWAQPTADGNSFFVSLPTE